MKITMSDIRRRINNTSSTYNIKNDTNITLLTEQCTRSSVSVNTIEKLIENWRELDKNSDKAFEKMLDIIKEYCSIGKSKSDINKSMNIISEKALPKVDNLKKARKRLEKFISETSLGHAVLEDCELYIGCDRVINNQNKICSKIDVDGLVRESNIIDESSLVDCIYTLCESIDTFNTSFEIKYNLMLENILYTLNKNYVKVEPRLIVETVTDYFLYRDVSDEDITTMKEILSESVYYDDKDKENMSFILDEEVIEEGYKGNPVKDILNKLKTEKTKSPGLVKSVVNKIYTKSSNNIIDETPNFLSWIRQFLIFSTVGINPYLGAISLFVDKFIQMKLQRDETDRFIRKIESEKKKATSKLSKIKDNKAKSNCEDYIKNIDNNLKKLSEYRESLYTEKELDKMEDEKEISLESFLREDKITIKEYYDNHHFRVVSEMNKAIKELKNITNSRYRKLVDSKVLNIVSRDESVAFENSNETTIENYIGGDNRLFINLGECLPLNFISETDTIDTMKNILSNIIDILQDKLDCKFVVFFDGDDDLYHIYLSYDLSIDEYDITNENTIHENTARDMSLILALEMSVKEYIDDNTEDILSSIDEELGLYDADDIENITSFSLINSDIIKPTELYNLFSVYKNNLYKSDKEDKYIKGSSLQESMYRLGKSKTSVSNRNRYEIYNDLIITNEAISAIRDINESSVKNNITIARDKLKKATIKLSDKEKMVSRQMDNSLSKFNEKVQKELTSKNREAVIKGTILPSASSVIKIAIASSTLALINPALAVIATIGGIASSKIGTRKEKQFILDEIEIQLKVVEKKIQLAEANNDMTSLEQLLKIEQKLKRERQRIIYRLKNYYPVNAK